MDAFKIEKIFINAITNNIVKVHYYLNDNCYGCYVQTDNPSDDEKGLDLGQYVRGRMNSGKIFYGNDFE